MRITIRDIVYYVGALVISVIGGVVVVWIQDKPWLGIVVAAGILVVLLSVVGVMRIRSTTAGILATLDDLKRDAHCCKLRVAGVYGAYGRAGQSHVIALKRAKTSLKFVGVCAAHILENPRFRRLLDDRLRGNFSVQILILDPNAAQAIRSHAVREGSQIDRLKERIAWSVGELRDLRNTHGAEKVKVYLYDCLPPYRVLLIDDYLAYVSFYGVKGEKGVDAPQLVFVNTERSLFAPFFQYYTNTFVTAAEA